MQQEQREGLFLLGLHWYDIILSIPINFFFKKLTEFWTYLLFLKSRVELDDWFGVNVQHYQYTLSTYEIKAKYAHCVLITDVIPASYFSEGEFN